ncbi:MAG: TonB family protein [Pseudomonadota bacterium]
MAAFVRYGLGVVVGGAVAIFLLWLMQYLIATGENLLNDNEPFRFVDFVRVEKEEVTEVKQRERKRPPKPEEAPPDMAPPQQDSLNPEAQNIYVAPVAVDSGDMSIGSAFGLTESDGEYLPIVKVSPIYPRRAQQRGIEGYCTVEYTVTVLGTVENPRVVDCSSSLFERASLKASLKFKYKPRVVDGEAIAVPGVQNRFTYVLDQ